jgi:hypothetical protein
MYINRKMRPVETTPGVAVRRRKENDGEREWAQLGYIVRIW